MLKDITRRSLSQALILSIQRLFTTASLNWTHSLSSYSLVHSIVVITLMSLRGTSQYFFHSSSSNVCCKWIHNLTDATRALVVNYLLDNNLTQEYTLVDPTLKLVNNVDIISMTIYVKESSTIFRNYWSWISIAKPVHKQHINILTISKHCKLFVLYKDAGVYIM